MSVIGLLGASGFVAWSVMSRPDAALITSEQAHSFDLKEAPSAAPTAAPRPVEELHDAVAAPVSPRPIAMAGMAATAPAAPAAPAAVRPQVRPFLTPQLETAVRKSKFFAAMLRAPARFLVAASALKSPRALRSFLENKSGVEAYMNSTVVRVVLNSPSVAKSVLGSPALVRAFLSSPAMKDPQAVRELLESRMVVKMLDCPGVQEALADPAVIRNMLADPGTIQWMGENPEAMHAIASAAPALARSLSAATR